MNWLEEGLGKLAFAGLGLMIIPSLLVTLVVQHWHYVIPLAALLALLFAWGNRYSAKEQAKEKLNNNREILRLYQSGNVYFSRKDMNEVSAEICRIESEYPKLVVVNES